MLFLSIFVSYALLLASMRVLSPSKAELSSPSPASSSSSASASASASSLLRLRRLLFSRVYLPFELLTIVVLITLVMGLPSVFSGTLFISTLDGVDISFGFDAVSLLFGAVFFTTILLLVRCCRVVVGVERFFVPFATLSFVGVVLLFSLNPYIFLFGVSVFALSSFVHPPSSLLVCPVGVRFAPSLFLFSILAVLLFVGFFIETPDFMFYNQSVLIDATLSLLSSTNAYLFNAVFIIVSLLFVLGLHSIVLASSSVVGHNSVPLFVYRVLQMLLLTFVFIKFAPLLSYTPVALVSSAVFMCAYFLYATVVALRSRNTDTILLCIVAVLSLWGSVLYSYDHKYFAVLTIGTALPVSIFVGMFIHTTMFAKLYALFGGSVSHSVCDVLPCSWRLLRGWVTVFVASILFMGMTYPLAYTLATTALGLFDYGLYPLGLYPLLGLWLVVYAVVSVTAVHLVRVYSHAHAYHDAHAHAHAHGDHSDHGFWWFVLPWGLFVVLMVFDESYLQGVFAYVELGSYLSESSTLVNTLDSLFRATLFVVVASFVMPVWVFASGFLHRLLLRRVGVSRRVLRKG